VLIQDAACSVGATYKGLKTGNPSLANAAAFSFHGRKGITCGEGGALVMRSEKDLAIARSLSSFGVDSALNRLTSNDLVIPEFVRLGYNYKLSDIASAVMRAQLKKVDRLIQRRREIAVQYDAAFDHLEQAKPFPVLEDRQSAYQSYVLTVNDKIDRNKLIIALRKAGVGCNIGTFSSHLQPIYRYLDELPVSKKLFEQQVAIPMHGNIKDSQIDFVIEKVNAELNSKENWRN
jgi:dTDP-4-amino-4,6-dideoxygalactose transaminase